MQLRVARLCLDCEELHVEDACPICASEHYAFLSAWLPSEERRRWRRSPPAFGSAPRGVRRLANRIARWFTSEPLEAPPSGPKTRASDHVPKFDFDTPNAPSQKPKGLEPRAAQATREGGP